MVLALHFLSTFSNPLMTAQDFLFVILSHLSMKICLLGLIYPLQEACNMNWLTDLTNKWANRLTKWLTKVGQRKNEHCLFPTLLPSSYFPLVPFSTPTRRACIVASLLYSPPPLQALPPSIFSFPISYWCWRRGWEPCVIGTGWTQMAGRNPHELCLFAYWPEEPNSTELLRSHEKPHSKDTTHLAHCKSTVIVFKGLHHWTTPWTRFVQPTTPSLDHTMNHIRPTHDPITGPHHESDSSSLRPHHWTTPWTRFVQSTTPSLDHTMNQIRPVHDPITGPHHEPDSSSPRPPTVLLENQILILGLYYRLRLGLPTDLILQILQSKLSIHLSYVQWFLRVQSIVSTD
jgi:hypothetical protein